MTFTENEKKALQLMIDSANETDEDDGSITYFAVCKSEINERTIKGYRGICSSLMQKGMIVENDAFYCNARNIPIDKNYKIKFEEIK